MNFNRRDFMRYAAAFGLSAPVACRKSESEVKRMMEKDVFCKTDLKALSREDVFDLIGQQWMLVTAGTSEKFNTMTASWGGVGWLWNQPVAFVFVRPERYTHDFLEAESRLTLSFYPESCRDKLKFCGTKSGREVDKVAETGLRPVRLESGAITFAQSRLTLDCRKLFKSSMTSDAFVDASILARWYGSQPGGSLHDVYIAAIEQVYLPRVD